MNNRLTKAKLNTLLRKGLSDLGYTEFKDSISGYQGLYAKKLDNGLYLSLGLTIHRYYEDAFTADFYLSETTFVGATWGDIPKKSDQRPGGLLFAEEILKYEDGDLNVKGSHDIWWHGYDDEALSDFIQVISFTEPRFINQPDLILAIKNSKDGKLISQCALKTIEFAIENKLNDPYDFLPPKEIDNIPMIWFMAAEKAMIELKESLSVNGVKATASDAYRQYVLSHLGKFTGK